MILYLLPMLMAYLTGSKFISEQKKDRSAIISALRNALRLTKKHIGETRRSFGDVESAELAKAWSEVARLIRPLDAHTATIFEAKADYWTDPIGFKQEIQDGNRRYDFRIQILEVEKYMTNLELN